MAVGGGGDEDEGAVSDGGFGGYDEEHMNDHTVPTLYPHCTQVGTVG